MDQDPLAELLLPIRADAPSGDDLSFSREFDLIQEARREDDATLDQGDWVKPLKQADWPGVVAQTSALLRTRTKDLRLAVWLADAWCKTDGFAGLARGMALVERLLEQFWNDVHPQPDEGDPEQRIGNLSWLVTRAAQLVREIPLTRSEGGAYSFVDHEAARALQLELDRNPDEAEALAANKVTLARFQTARRGTERGFYTGLLADAAACELALEALNARADARLGTDGPSFAPLRESLGQVRQLLDRLAQDAGAVAAASASASAAEPAVAQSRRAAAGPLASRAHALQQLREVAEFFRRTEPHSPVAYLADKAARWGAMPLHTWLRAVIKDDGALARLEELLGIEDSTPRRGADEGRAP